MNQNGLIWLRFLKEFFFPLFVKLTIKGQIVC